MNSSARAGLFFGLFLLVISWLAPPAALANKCGVNVGPYYNQASEVRQMTQEGGWIVALGTLGDCSGLESLFGQGLNVVIRAYNGGQAFDEQQALAWTATLGKLDSKGQMIYFMPWNEPDHENEGGGVNNGPASYEYVQTLKRYLDEAGLLNKKVVVLSPMIDKHNANYEQFFNGVGKDTYYRIGSGSSINEYDRFEPTACTSGVYTNNCKYNDLTLGIPGPYYAPEAGVTNTCGGPIPCYNDGEIRTMLDASWRVWSGDGQFQMFAIFSYDPHRAGVWNIFTAPQTRAFYQNSCSTGAIVSTTGYDQGIFQTWLTGKAGQLTECGGCGMAPAGREGLCTGAGKDGPAGFDLSMYDEYHTTDEEFYLRPLQSLAKIDTDSSVNLTANAALVRNELVDQGYQAFCAADPVEVTTYAGPAEMLKLFFHPKNNPGGTTVSFESTETLDYTNARTPLFRDIEGKRFLFSSIEEFWGFKDTIVQDPSQAEIRSAPINSLLTNAQRCRLAARTLFAIDERCKILEKPGECVLYKRKIPTTMAGANYTAQSLLEDYIAHNLECEEIIDNAAKGMGHDKALLDGLLNAPLYIDRAYRPAFLVLSIEQIPSRIDKMFSFFSFSKDADAKHEVLAVAFKVPDIGTNRGIDARGEADDESETEDISYFGDPLLLTRDSLLTNKTQRDKQDTMERLMDTLKRTSNEAHSQVKSDAIYCDGASDSPNCERPLTRALVDLINGQSRDPETQNLMMCRYTTSEDSYLIGDAAKLEANPDSQTSFLDSGQAWQLIEKLLPDKQTQVFKSDFNIKKELLANPGQSQALIKTYLVYPVGYELKTVEDALLGTFFTEYEVNSLKAQNLNKQGFQMQSTIQDLSNSNYSRDFTDNTDCRPEIVRDPITKQEITISRCATKSFGYGVEDKTQEPARILGGGLGYAMRIIQLNLHELVSEARDYLKTCKTTEEFLTGNCSGPDVAPRYGKSTPRFASIGQYCGVNQDIIENGSANYAICKERECRTVLDESSPGYFLDPTSKLKIKLAHRIIDGATLLLTGDYVPYNPAQDPSNRCGDGHNGHPEIWYFPPNYKDIDPTIDLNNIDHWTWRSTRLVYHGTSQTYTNFFIDLNVRPGYYHIEPWTTPCIMEKTIYPNNQYYFELSDSSLGKDKFCAAVTSSSNMPGGYFTKTDKVFNCQLSSEYDLSYSNACGGLSDDKLTDLWDNLSNPPGLSLYEQVFGRKFTVPPREDSNNPYRCPDLFPNTIVEYANCDQVNNGRLCNVAETGPCAVENLTQVFIDAGRAPDEASASAVAASKICYAESRGNPTSMNKGCLSGSSLDYSIGLFQINLLAHDVGLNCTDIFSSIDENAPSCSLNSGPTGDGDLWEDRIVRCQVEMLDPNKNIAEMVRLSGKGRNWTPWSAAKVCGII